MLRNAFDLLATESTLKKILNALFFAKDPNDRLRVVVDNSTLPVSSTDTFGTATNTVPTPYSLGSPNATDAREDMRLAMRANAQQARARWTF